MKKSFFLIFGVLSCLYLAAGCKGGSDEPIPPEVNVTGMWELKQDAQTDAHTMELEQHGSRVSGTAVGFIGQTVPVVGFVTGHEITMMMSLGSTNYVDFTGTASHNFMSGTWRNDADERGSWTASRK